MSLEEVIEELYELEDQEKAKFRKAKFGIEADNFLGVYHKDLNRIAKEIGKNNQLALQLFETGIYEARLLCSKIFNPKNVTEELMEKWVKTFENWEICDSFCMGIFAKSEFALAKILDWSNRKEEFQKRAAFATMAAFCMADKKSENELFVQFFPIIKEASTDDRKFVKKAVNWALRGIGKRNKDLKKEAIKASYELIEMKSDSANWIGRNALTELEKPEVRSSDYPRKIYRPK